MTPPRPWELEDGWRFNKVMPGTLLRNEQFPFDELDGRFYRQGQGDQEQSAGVYFYTDSDGGEVVVFMAWGPAGTDNHCKFNVFNNALKPGGPAEASWSKVLLGCPVYSRIEHEGVAGMRRTIAKGQDEVLWFRGKPEWRAIDTTSMDA